MDYSIYRIENIETLTTYYIGQTTNPAKRFKQHLKNSEWLKEVLEQGIQVQMVILEEGLTKEKAKQQEKAWIKHYQNQGILLKNGTYNWEYTQQAEEDLQRWEYLLKKFSHLPNEKQFLLATMHKKGWEHFRFEWNGMYSDIQYTIDNLNHDNFLSSTPDEEYITRLAFKHGGCRWNDEMEDVERLEG